MPNENLHWMKLYPERFMSSARYRMLDLSMRGAYHDILMLCWMNGGAMPKQCLSNAQALQRALGCDSETAERVILEVVNVFFESDSEGMFRNKKLNAVRDEALAEIASKTRRGKLGADARWKDKNQCLGNAKGMPKECLGNAKGMPKECLGNAILELEREEYNTPLTPVGGEPPAVVSKRSKIETIEIPDVLKTRPGFDTAWEDWNAYRRERRIKTTPMTLKAQLSKLSETPDDAEVMIRQSIANGWQGLFPLKTADTANSTQDKRGLAIGQCWQSERPFEFDIDNQKF